MSTNWRPPRLVFIPYNGTPEGCSNKGARVPLVVLSEVPFHNFQVNVRNVLVSLKLVVLVQIWDEGLYVNILHGVAFNTENKNAFICLC